MKKRIFLLLGSNLGERMENLHRACEFIGKKGCKILKTSAIYETAAWGKTDQPSFYNQVLEIETDLGAEQLLNEVLDVEISLGRVRTEKWGERLIDIDILFFNDEIIKTPHLQIPHPAIGDRRFTLEPLCEIAPDFKHPIMGKSIQVLLQECTDPLPVTRIKSN